MEKAGFTYAHVSNDYVLEDVGVIVRPDRHDG